MRSTTAHYYQALTFCLFSFCLNNSIETTFKGNIHKGNGLD